jgi:hypothetical protein
MFAKSLDAAASPANSRPGSSAATKEQRQRNFKKPPKVISSKYIDSRLAENLSPRQP